ncbi:MAG: hypothetical protein E7408_07755 [Ruminococcaceae bacterium]|nr:hypothetical protein [Oscillospiraceae bacterium]
MVSRALLEKLEFEGKDIEYIVESDGKYGDRIAPLSALFMNNNKSPAERRKDSEEFVQKAIETAPECDNQYILQLLFWLYCVPFAKEHYEKNNISEEVLYNTMQDLTCKTRECKEVHGKVGCYSPWFYLHFSYVYFGLGRLQFYVENYTHAPYSKKGYTIKTGDRIYSCHIPSGSKLTEEKCMESFQKAYEFFKPELKGDILPLICASWLLYPPYIERVFPKGSNMERFAKLFDIIGQNETGQRFSECERIFGVPYEGNTNGFPDDNTLRRNMIAYMNSGSASGHGIGIILYDGEKKRIL